LSQTPHVYQRMFGYLRPYAPTVVLAYGATIAAVLLQLLVPQLIKQAIDEGLAAGQFSALVQAAGLILLVTAVRGFASFAELYYAEWLTFRFSYDLRNAFYNAIQYLPFSFHDSSHTGDMMSRATSDIGETERFVGVGMAGLISTLLLLGGVIIAMFLENAFLASLAMLPMILLVIVALRFGFAVRDRFRVLQEQMGVISKTMQESLTGINLVKAFAREGHELEKFDTENNEWFRQRVDLITVWSNNWPFMTFLVGVSIFLLLWFGAPLVLDGTITVGALFALISYVLLLNGPVQRIGFLVNSAATAGAAAHRVFSIMDIPNEIEPDK
jgi:ATP-binding cassette, subfamily B, multidrug efflux pump